MKLLLDKRGRPLAFDGGKRIKLPPYVVVRSDGAVRCCPHLLGPREPELPTVVQSIARLFGLGRKP